MLHFLVMIEIKAQVESEKNCGGCQLFDTNNCQGKPVGTTSPEKGNLKRGFCRGLKGLILGEVNESTICKQSEGIYKSKSRLTVDLGNGISLQFDAETSPKPSEIKSSDIIWITGNERKT